MPMVASPDDPGDDRAVERFTFHNNEIRTVMINGLPWWVAADVCSVLEIGNPSQAVSYLDEDERASTLISSEGGQSRPANVINEPGLYSLLLRSRKPQARAFKRWITHEVIPAIRKTGSYGQRPALPSNRDLALMVIAEADRADVAEAKVKELEPAAKAWDVLASAEGDYSLREAALFLNRDRGISTGQNRLLRSIRELDMIDRKGVPYAKHASHLVERATSYIHPHTNEPTLSKQIRVTVQGLRYLHKRLGGEGPLDLTLPAAS